MVPALRVLLLAAALPLVACVPSDRPTGGEIALGVRVEQVRAHLGAAGGNAAAGRWDLAAVHASHPAEDLPAIDRMLRAKDPTASASLAARLAGVRHAADVRDLAALAAALAAADSELERVPSIVMGSGRSQTLAYRASLVAALVDATAGEYGEAYVDGAIAVEAEYQDAHSFLARARTIWGGIDADLAARAPRQHGDVAPSMERLALIVPSLELPRTAAPPAEVRSLAGRVRESLEAAGAGEPEAPAASLSGALDHLAAALAAIGARDAAAASAEVARFAAVWPDVEGLVVARSSETYAAIEDDMARAAAALRQADLDEARAAITRMREGLAPFASTAASYGVFDSAIILFREGLEALLVIAALLTFLARTGNADKRRWIWGGAGAGVALSVAVGSAATLVFSGATAGADRELLEGVVGLVAAALLVYMSWWLHSRSSLAAWQRYVRDKATAALARNSVISLATISFLAVFREGAETVIFYAGIAPSIAVTDLALGIAIGAAGLAAIGTVMLAFSVKLPIRLFFTAASVLLYYLAFKFVGTGIHALQVAGAFQATPAPVPPSGIFGVFPTWETTIPQALLLLAAAAVLLAPRIGRVPSPGAPAPV